MVAWIEQVWFGDDPEGRGEIGDAVRLSIRNPLIAHQFMVKLIATDKRVVWVQRS